MADTKVSALTSATPVGTDELYLVDDPGGTPSSKRATAQSVADLKTTEVSEDTTPQLGGDLDGQGNAIQHYTNAVVGTVSGALTTAAHAGNILVTSGNVTVPTTAGFTCVLIAGGAHTVTFNATTSAAMAAGDLMTVVVEDSTTIHAVLTAAADKVSFS